MKWIHQPQDALDVVMKINNHQQAGLTCFGVQHQELSMVELNKDLRIYYPVE